MSESEKPWREMKWCHRHSRPVGDCRDELCTANANNQQYATYDPNIPPTDPVSKAETIGYEFYHVYEANIQAGFTPQQALYLLAVQMSGNPGIAPGPDLPEPPGPPD